MNNASKIVNFTNLDAWQYGHRLVLIIYRETKHFPKEEIYALTGQMRRCVVSITSNIAEGFSRKSYKEKIQFYSIALGSTTELQNQLLIAKDVGYIDSGAYNEILELSIIVHKLLNGLIKGARKYA